jgi:hypothetical protein
MNKLFFVLVAILMSAGTLLANDSYKLNDEKVDGLFSAATETSMSVMDVNLMGTDMAVNTVAGSESTGKVIIAVVVDWFVGGFGIHRYVLGTKGSMWAIYTFTVCGIFGIVPFVDFWVLLIDGAILGHGDKYMDNNKFFMWGGK